MILQNDAISVRVDPPLGTIVLNRPDKGNALTLAMADALVDAVGDLHLEKKVRAVAIAGAGESFCVGRDVVEMHGGQEDAPPGELPPTPERWGEEEQNFREVIVALLELPKPVIATVSGLASGMGFALALASDLIIASRTAVFSLPDARQGLVAGLAAPLLGYRAGAATAARLLMHPDECSAEQLHQLGLVHELVEPDLLWARASQLAGEIAAAAPESLSLSKRLLLDTLGERLLTDLTSGAIVSATARTTAAAREGLQAHIEGRDPVWG